MGVVVEVASTASMISKTTTCFSTDILKRTFFAMDEVNDVRGCTGKVLFDSSLFSSSCESNGCCAIFNISTGLAAVFGVTPEGS